MTVITKIQRDDGIMSFKIRGYDKNQLLREPCIVLDGFMHGNGDNYYAFGTVPLSEVNHLIDDLTRWRDSVKAK